MALVAYDDSDISEDECEENTDETVLIQQIQNNVINDSEQKGTGGPTLKLPPPKSNQNVENETFLKLPQPKEMINVAIVEEDDEFLKKKEKPEIKPPPPVTLRKPVKIQLTALSDLHDDDRPAVAMPIKAPSENKSGLLGMLPPPKEYIVSHNTKKSMMVPHVLTKKPAAKPIPSPKKSITKSNNAKPLIHYDSSDESDSENLSENSSNQNSDFFSLNQEYKLPEVPYENIPSEPIRNKFNEIPNKNFVETPIIFENVDTEQTINEEAQDGELSLDEEALRKLCGSRAKRFKPESIQIIDMSHKDILPNEEEWMREALQEATAGPRASHSVKPLGGPSSTQKRKHQITYLAQQAKANELELQNQWANNRMTRRQTQSKYGF